MGASVVVNLGRGPELTECRCRSETSVLPTNRELMGMCVERPWLGPY